MLWLFLPFGGFLGLDGQQGHDGNDQSFPPDVSVSCVIL